MQVMETSASGLKRELRVTVPKGTISERFDKRLDEVKSRANLKGFRPGKVPANHLRKIYGRSLMVEVLQLVVDETSRKALDQRSERPAVEPRIKLTEDKAEIEQVMAGSADLAYTMAYEVLPKVEVADLRSIKLERPVAKVGETEIDKSIDNLIDNSLSYEVEADRQAAKGDKVTIDFVGRIDGAEFDGGKAEDAELVLGESSFIPGFEVGLEGVKAGDRKTIEATFPAPYSVPALAGKSAAFEITVKAVGKPIRPVVDAEFAKRFGFEEVGKLREAVGKRLEQEFQKASRTKAKRALLDALDSAHSFELPAALVDGEFNDIWGQVERGLKEAGRTLADEGQSEEQAKSEYRTLAQRRVRLGLVLSQIGEANEIKVADDELARSLAEHVRRFPGQEQKAYDYYRKTPGALAQIRAPLYEDKVVNFVLELADVTDKPVSAEELVRVEDDDDHGHHAHGDDHGHDHDHDHHGHDHDHHHDHDPGHDHDHDHGTHKSGR